MLVNINLFWVVHLAPAQFPTGLCWLLGLLLWMPLALLRPRLAVQCPPVQQPSLLLPGTCVL